MGRSEDFGLIFFGWVQAGGTCRPIEPALKALMFIFDSCHSYTYIYIGIGRAANTILSIEVGVSSIEIGVSSKYTFFVIAGKRIFVLLQSGIGERLYESCFSFGGWRKLPFLVLVFVLLLLVFIDFSRQSTLGNPKPIPH